LLSPFSISSSSLSFFQITLNLSHRHSLPDNLLIWVQFGYYFEIPLKTKTTLKCHHGSREGKKPERSRKLSPFGFCGVKQASSSAPSRLPAFTF
jgi:hypothetical protein